MTPMQKIASLIREASKEGTTTKDQERLKAAIREDGRAFRELFDLAHSAKWRLIDKLAPTGAGRVMYEQQLEQLRYSLGYEEASAIERLLIERVIFCWLRLEWAETMLTVLMRDQVSFREVAWVEKQLSITHTRYLKACDALVKTQAMLSRTNSARLEKTREFLDPKRRPQGKPELKIISGAG